MHRPHPARAFLGFTLLEVAIVLVVMGIIAAVVVPSYGHMLARQQLRAAGETLALDLRNAREEALRSGQPVFVSSRGGTAWCWGISRGQPCDCAGGVPACGLARGQAQDYPLVELGRSDALQFEPRMGRLLSAGQIELKTRKSQSLQVQVSEMGRARVCGPDAPKPQAC
jgi:type IV fimbrial biogenesis protein FimT